MAKENQDDKVPQNPSEDKIKGIGGFEKGQANTQEWINENNRTDLNKSWSNESTSEGYQPNNPLDTDNPPPGDGGNDE